jgi:hypothetical protein
MSVPLLTDLAAAFETAIGSPLTRREWKIIGDMLEGMRRAGLHEPGIRSAFNLPNRCPLCQRSHPTHFGCEICDQQQSEKELNQRERYLAKSQPIVDELASIQARRQKPVVMTIQLTPEQEAELRALLEGLIR